MKVLFNKKILIIILLILSIDLPAQDNGRLSLFQRLKKLTVELISFKPRPGSPKYVLKSLDSRSDTYVEYWNIIHQLSRAGYIGKTEMDATMAESYAALNIMEEDVAALEAMRFKLEPSQISKIQTYKEFIANSLLELTTMAIGSWETIDSRIESGALVLSEAKNKAWIKEQEGELKKLKEDLKKIQDNITVAHSEYELKSIQRIKIFISAKEEYLFEQEKAGYPVRTGALKKYNVFTFRGIPDNDQMPIIPLEYMNILVIDDDADKVSKFMGSGRTGHNKIDTKATFEGGLQALSAKRYDIIFMDLHINSGMHPDGTDGLVLIKKVRELGVNTPIICMSTNLKEETLVKLFEAGFDGYVNVASTDIYDMDIKFSVWVNKGIIELRKNKPDEIKPDAGTELNNSSTTYNDDAFLGNYSEDDLPAKYDTKGMKVLVVDDAFAYEDLDGNKQFETTLRNVFEKKLKCKMDVASNTADATKLINLNQYDVIFMDINMDVSDVSDDAPFDLSGLAFTKKLRAEHNTTPIIGISTQVGLERRMEMFNSGMNGYIGIIYDDGVDLQRRFTVWAQQGIMKKQDLAVSKNTKSVNKIPDQQDIFSEVGKNVVKTEAQMNALIDGGLLEEVMESVVASDNPNFKEVKLLQLEQVISDLSKYEIYKLMSYEQIKKFESIQVGFKVAKDSEYGDMEMIKEYDVRNAISIYLHRFIDNAEKTEDIIDEAITKMAEDGELESKEVDLLLGKGKLFYFIIRSLEKAIAPSADLVSQGVLLNAWLLKTENFEQISVNYPMFNKFSLRLDQFTKRPDVVKLDIKPKLNLVPKIK
ncbi:MAG: response regulator [bacterium]